MQILQPLQGKKSFYLLHISEFIHLTGCDLGRVNPRSLDVPDNFQDVFNNVNCVNTGTFYLIISREEVFAGIRF